MGEETRKEEFVESLGKIKDEIGEWHDWEELNSIAAKILDHSAGCKPQRQLKEITQQKYEAALSSANKLQNTLLPAAQRKESARRELDGQKASRAVGAVSALADNHASGPKPDSQRNMRSEPQIASRRPKKDR